MQKEKPLKKISLHLQKKFQVELLHRLENDIMTFFLESIDKHRDASRIRTKENEKNRANVE